LTAWCAESRRNDRTAENRRPETLKEEDQMTKKTLLGAGLALLSLVAIPAAAEAKTTVTIGQLDWPGASAIEQALAQVMTTYLDADVQTIAAAQEALYEALDKGDNSVDVVADMWTDHLPQQMKNYVLPGGRESIIINTAPYLGTEGIFVPSYVADEMGVRKLADLANPELAKLFDSDGNGKGEMWAGAVGWESTNHTEVRGKTYGFDKTMEYTTVEQAVFLAQLKDAIDNKKPIAFYYWTPEWIHAAYKLTKLEEPEFNGYANENAKGSERYNPEGCYKFYQPAERNDWLEASSISCSQPPTRAHIAFSKALADRAPQIAQFLKQVTLDADVINGWIYAMEVEKKPVDQVITAWIAANKDTVEGVWLKGIK
jgi:glycine betaine/proline transport system substrate-binding protein